MVRHCEYTAIPGFAPRGFRTALERHVEETATDMVVMGAYGHSRLREAIIGGATRQMLESAKVPVLMAH